MGVVLRTPQLNMELRIVPIRDLFMHEETIPTALEQLRRELASEQVLKHPMLVDSKTFVVLDGMHRVAALQGLGCKLAAACLLDYSDSAIKLFAWYREFHGKTSFSAFARGLARKLAYRSSVKPLSEAIRLVNSRAAFAALAWKNESYVLHLRSTASIKGSYSEIGRVEAFAKSMNCEVSYHTEADALEHLQGNSSAILVVPSLTKKEVIEAALQAQPFIHKTTRHVVPARPLFVNVPLEWLRQSDAKEANAKMKELLEGKHVVQQGPGAVIDGRRYEEFAYIFKDY
jgi:hypothetical protein